MKETVRLIAKPHKIINFATYINTDNKPINRI